MTQDQLAVSIVIPLHNEENILRSSLAELREALHGSDHSYEVILAENGSRDRTREIAAEEAEQHPEISVISYPEPNYGAALRKGIFHARGEYVICEEIDILDVSFHVRSLDLLRTRKADMVVGSKSIEGANDNRPLLRRTATRVFNQLLRIAVGFRGTDTHGIKAFRRSALLSLVKQCVVDKDVFASELVIRAERAGLRVMEVPIDITEKRATSIHLVRRVPHALANILRLVVYVRFGRRVEGQLHAEATKKRDEGP